MIATGLFLLAVQGLSIRDERQCSVHRHTLESVIMPATVIDIVGLFWRGGEDSCCIVCHTRLAHLTTLRDSPFYCTSTNRIRLTAGHYGSIVLTIYLYAVALLDGPAELLLCGPGSSPKPL